MRAAAEAANVPAVINARTDLFLKEGNASKHTTLVNEAISRGATYQDSGADCFFISGLSDLDLIKKICQAVALPVNVMVLDTTTDLSNLAKMGVARISFGPAPYFSVMASIGEAADRHF